MWTLVAIQRKISTNRDGAGLALPCPGSCNLDTQEWPAALRSACRPAGRIPVATARHLGATLVTADKVLPKHSKKGNLRAQDASRYQARQARPLAGSGKYFALNSARGPDL